MRNEKFSDRQAFEARSKRHVGVPQDRVKASPRKPTVVSPPMSVTSAAAPGEDIKAAFAEMNESFETLSSNLTNLMEKFGFFMDQVVVKLEREKQWRSLMQKDCVGDAYTREAWDEWLGRWKQIAPVVESRRAALDAEQKEVADSLLMNWEGSALELLEAAVILQPSE